jgi:hypothetical protein
LTLDTQIPISATATRRSRTYRARAVFATSIRLLKIPESYQFNVGFEREIFKGIVFETNFTLNKTVRLWREYNANAPILPAGTPDRDGNGEITFTDYLLGINVGNFAFQFSVRRPMTTV